MPEPVCKKLGMYIMTTEPVFMAYFINPSQESVSVYVSPIVVSQRLGKNVAAATNTHVKIEELLDMSYQSKLRDYFFPKLLVCY
jgi:hypothetical protein